MLTRRQFLKLGAAAGASMLVPWQVDTQRAFPGVKLSRAFAQAPLPAIVDPLYNAPIADPMAITKFVNLLPVIGQGPLAFLRKDVTAGATVQVNMGQTAQDLLGTGHMTPVWGYGVLGDPITYPGPTFVAMSGNAVNVNWVNGLGYNYLIRSRTAAGADAGPVVDETVHWAFGKTGGSFASDGIPAVPHLHGGHTDSDFDGLPEQWWTPTGWHGDTYVTDAYTYDNSQPAGTLWYHDHVLGITRLNVYAGLAGFYLLRDANEMNLINSGAIPSGNYEIELVIQDRMFYPDGQLAYPDVPWMPPGAICGQFPDRTPPNTCDPWPTANPPSHQPEFFGQVILVNGKAWPKLDVDQAQYRFRLLNGSDSRFYELWISDPVTGASPIMYVIGNDVGLLSNPVRVNRLTIGPGERYDLVVDFTGIPAGTQLIMRNNARSPFPKGVTVNPNLDGQIMAFVVGTGTGPAPVTMATALGGTVPVPDVTGVPTRKLMLFEALDHYGRLQPLLGTIGGTDINGNPADGTLLWDEPITENPGLNTTEVWEIHNATVDAHPIHLHLVRFQIVNRQKFVATMGRKINTDPNMPSHKTWGGTLSNITYKGKAKGPDAYEAGWKDTAIMYPGEVTRILVENFDKPGRYVWHCHILSHEDHEMMRPYFVV